MMSFWLDRVGVQIWFKSENEIASVALTCNVTNDIY